MNSTQDKEIRILFPTRKQILHRKFFRILTFLRSSFGALGNPCHSAIHRSSLDVGSAVEAVQAVALEQADAAVARH